jgi:ubiquinone biosynthesis protein COQ4
VKGCEEGRNLLTGRPVVDPRSCDLEELMRLPRGTFGREYAEWMRGQGFDVGAPAPTLAREAGNDAAGEAVPETDANYVCSRIVEVHDFWHVLTGYNCDEDGELGLMAFSLGQTGSRAISRALWDFARSELRFAWRTGDPEWRQRFVYLWRAWRRGRRARLLVAVELEDYFILPLDSVRQRLGIEPAAEAYSGHSLPPIAVPA